MLSSPGGIPPLSLSDAVQVEVLRGAETPDYFSSRPTKDLQAVLRETPTRPLAELLNTGEMSVDVDRRRIVRDVFWKGSFASDTLLGWEERVRTALLGPSGLEAGGLYAGGSFWKRFDTLENGVVTGHVVNYEIAALPGKPVVEAVEYPDDNRRYFRKGDRVLLLRYTNEPYRIVYDVIKIIDDQNAIGVMHLGTFPRGLEFSTFVMARHNYPFELMSIDDHRSLLESSRAARPDARDLAGEWTGPLIAAASSEPGLARPSPAAFTLSFEPTGTGLQGRGTVGLSGGSGKNEMGETHTRNASVAEWQQDLRLLGEDTLLGRWRLASGSTTRWSWLERFVEKEASGPMCSFVLSRAQAAER